MSRFIAIVNCGCELEWSGTIREEMGLELGPDNGLDYG